VEGTEGKLGERQNTVKNGKKGGGLAAPEHASIFIFDKSWDLYGAPRVWVRTWHLWQPLTPRLPQKVFPVRIKSVAVVIDFT